MPSLRSIQISTQAGRKWSESLEKPWHPLKLEPGLLVSKIPSCNIKALIALIHTFRRAQKDTLHMPQVQNSSHSGKVAIWFRDRRMNGNDEEIYNAGRR